MRQAVLNKSYRIATYLNFLEQLRYLMEVEPCVNGTVNTLHG